MTKAPNKKVSLRVKLSKKRHRLRRQIEQTRTKLRRLEALYASELLLAEKLNKARQTQKDRDTEIVKELIMKSTLVTTKMLKDGN